MDGILLGNCDTAFFSYVFIKAVFPHLRLFFLVINIDKFIYYC
ncbi:hypothetical protein ESCAB7627_1833 [Escherichia albertii TW07627]|uniref:Uncharacterized protein n=1 Tax=Escherichia albertii (strain TW07627) TaxID=502347 RepID=A0ABC9NIZ2_ESCAT|nr:hypothetical protein ESCAB7627_1833 [Escherichia albertii TW07627]